jgi:uncharacterized protein YceK
MVMKKILMILVAGALMSGCANTVGNKNMGASESKIAQQMSTVKTKSDARKTFGTANLVFDKGAGEVHEYKVVSGAGRYHWMIPVAGWVMSLWQDDYTYQETNLFITYDNNGNVKDWNVIRTGGTTN